MQRPFKGMNKVELLKSINEGPKLEPPENSNISISLNLRNFLSFVSSVVVSVHTV